MNEDSLDVNSQIKTKTIQKLWPLIQKIEMKNKPGYQALPLQFVLADYQLQGPNFLLYDTTMDNLNLSNKMVEE